MARFNLADYETVEERIKRFYTDYPDGRILTENETIPEYRAEKIWVVRALVFLNGEDVERACPKASGLAYEVDSASGPQAASALEVCETSGNRQSSGQCRLLRQQACLPGRDGKGCNAMRRKLNSVTGCMMRNRQQTQTRCAYYGEKHQKLVHHRKS
jgi:hypothetical protein